MENIWFSADFHFGHDKIISIENRPVTIEDHNDWLIDIWNSTVNKKDTIYLLGDFALFHGSEHRLRTEKILHKLHGNKVLIIGNHDESIANSTCWNHSTLIKDFKYKPLGIHIVLCHYPIASWNRAVHGSFHLHGHTHGRHTNGGLSFDCGLGANNFKILHLDEVVTKFEQLKKQKDETNR